MLLFPVSFFLVNGKNMHFSSFRSCIALFSLLGFLFLFQQALAAPPALGKRSRRVENDPPLSSDPARNTRRLFSSSSSSSLGDPSLPIKAYERSVERKIGVQSWLPKYSDKSPGQTTHGMDPDPSASSSSLSAGEIGSFHLTQQPFPPVSEDGGLFSCWRCGDKLFAEKTLQIHLDGHDKHKHFYCLSCDSQSATKQEFSDHLESEEHKTRTLEEEDERKRPHRCKVCSKRFEKPFALNIHQTVHTQEKKFECKICHKRYGAGSTLKVHILQHDDVHDYCIRCDEVLKDEQATREHRSNHKRGTSSRRNDGTLFCPLCSIVRHTSTETVETHLRIDHDWYKSYYARPSNADSSEAAPRPSAPLPEIQHAQHIQNDPLSTDASLTSPNSDHPESVVRETLAIVQETAGQEKKEKYPCQFCDKRFSNPYNAKIHERRHTGVKPYECVKCAKPFSRGTTCKNHQASHGDNDFQCSPCVLEFNNEEEMKDHRLQWGHYETVSKMFPENDYPRPPPSQTPLQEKEGNEEGQSHLIASTSSSISPDILQPTHPSVQAAPVTLTAVTPADKPIRVWSIASMLNTDSDDDEEEEEEDDDLSDEN